MRIPGSTLELSEPAQAAIARLACDEVIIPPPIERAREAYPATTRSSAQHALGDPGAVLVRQGRPARLMTPFYKVLEFEAPNYRWFIGGSRTRRSTASIATCIPNRRNKAAIIWYGEDGEEHTYTYNRLYREVNWFGNALRRMGVKRGDWVDPRDAARARG
ncbi:MAG: hypothetical protein IPJ04_16710 [Candidatus Eisenbacteria bacterium]|nr:hypothetical protein [Candidatus Eisenbacteria bacterium]